MNFSHRYRVEPGVRVRLDRIDPDDTGRVKNKDEGRERAERHLERLADLHYRLYAENRRSVLIVLQGMDAAGKDGVIRHVLAGLNPQACRVASFKVPTEEELGHDFLWRIHKAVPRRGEIGVFNRSHYEEVLVVRVKGLVPASVWSARYEQINAFEHMLVDSGTTILKFFIHISPAEQRTRLLARLADPQRNWKFSAADIEVRQQWDAYQRAYEDALTKCSTPWAPWYIIPGNHKWLRNLAVSDILVAHLEAMDLRFPKPMGNIAELERQLRRGK